MANPLLMSQLHGDGNFDSNIRPDPEYEAALDRLAEAYAIEEAEGLAAISTVLTKGQAKDHLKKVFKKAVRLEEQQIFLNQAMRCILQDGSRYLSKDVWSQLSQELSLAANALAKLTYHEETPDILFPYLGMTQKGMDAIAAMAKAKYEEENYALSMSLNVLLTTLDPEGFDYWFHLAISCQESGFFDKAIKAYSICHLLNFKHVPSWLLCAECYLHSQNKLDAKIEFEEAERIIASSNESAAWQEQVTYLKKCLEEYRS